jgi:hypothetical protein
MPIFSVEAPNGKIYDVEAPEGTPEQSILAFANQAYAQDQSRVREPALIEAAPVEPKTGFSALIPSIKRGGAGLASLTGDVLPAMAGRVGEKLGISGAKEFADRQMAEAAAEQERIQQMYPSAVPSYKDIKGGGDLLTYVVESVGELIPSMLPSVLTGGVAGVAGRGAMVAAEQAAKKASMDAAQKTLLSYSGSKLSQQELVNLATADAVKAGQAAAQKVALKYQAAGAVTGSAAQNVPEVYQNVAQETGKEDLGAALLFGGFNSILDAITPLTLLRKAKGVGLTENELIGAWYKRAGKGALTGFATEGSTEAVQEMSSAAAEKFVDNNKEFFNKENFERFINAGLKGGIGGGVASGATNVAFGQREPKAVPQPSTVEPTTTSTAPAFTVVPDQEVMSEEAFKAFTEGKKKEEVADVNRPTFTQASGASAGVSGEPGAGGAPAGAAGSESAGMADVAGATSLIEGGDGEQQRSLVPTEEDELRAAEASAAANAPFVQWLADNGYGDKDLSAEQYAELRKQFDSQSKEVLPNLAKEVEKKEIAAAPVEAKPVEAAPVEAKPVEVAPVVEAKPVEVAAAPVVEAKTEPKKPIPAPKYNASKTTQDLIAAEKARRASSKKPVEVMNQKVETGLDVEPEARRSETHQAGISLAQTYRQQQTALAREIDTDETLSKEEKAAGKAFQNYMIVGNNNIKNALNILAADMFDGAAYNSNPYLPNVGGASAKLFYGSLNPANKKFVDDKVAFLKAQEQRLKKFSGDKKDQTKKDFDEYGESIEIKLTGKQRKDLNKANKEQIKQNEAKIKEYNENLKKLGEVAKAEGEMFGGTTPTFMAHVLRGDLRSALNDVVKDNSGEFTALDKLVAKRLLSAKTLPSVVVVDKLPDGALGAYDSGVDTMYIAQNALNSHIVLHEAVHGHTLTMIRDWENGDVINNGVASLNELYEFLKANHPELATEYGIKEDLAEFASEVMSNRNFQDRLKKIPYKRSNVFTEFARAVLRILGINEGDKFNALASALISLDTMLSTGRQYQESAEFAPGAGETAKYATDAQAKKEPKRAEYGDTKTIPELRETMPRTPDSPVHSIKKALEPDKRHSTYENVAKLIQNDRRAIYNWENNLVKANKIIYYGLNENDVATAIAKSGGEAEHLFNFNIKNPSQDLYKAIGAYADARGIKIQDALIDLQMIFTALHEPERRNIKYILNVPLPLEAAERRKEIVSLVRSNRVNTNQAKQLRSLLDELIADPNNQLKEGQKGYGARFSSADDYSSWPINKDAAEYNVVGNVDPALYAQVKKELYDNSAQKDLIDDIKKAVKALNEATIELDIRANYWSKPVSNLKAFYDYADYIPFKGKKDEKQSIEDQEIEFDSQVNGRELQEAAYSTEGRLSQPDNPLLQVLADGVRSAMRAGRGGTRLNEDGSPIIDIDGKPMQFGVTHAIVNAIRGKRILDENGNPVLNAKGEPTYGPSLISGKLEDTITFEQRYDDTIIQKLKEKGENNFFHYLPNGTIEIWSIDSPVLREAIRRSYKNSNPLLDTFSRVTSWVGQQHTRYNVAFAPKNFIGDTLANAGIMGAEMGVGKFGAVVGQVARHGLLKARKFSQLYAANKVDEIKRLAKTDDYIRDMWDYVSNGGKVSYISGVGAQSQFQKMQENIERVSVLTTKEKVDDFLDVYWAEPFELASRVAAYRVAKADYINNQNMNEKDAIMKATGYVKNLANFEQTGDYGKVLGSFFMFFRASATGAVRAIDALTPIFRDPVAAWAALPASVSGDTSPEGIRTKEEFFANMAKQRRTAMAMLAAIAGTGFSVYMMALAMADGDDEGRNRTAIDDMDRWTRFARFPIPGTEKIVQIPWGFGLGAFAAAGAQIAALLVGNSSYTQAFNNIKDVGMDSFLPLPTSKINMFENPAAWAMDSITPSIARPFFEYAMNMDGLGREIYNNRQSRVGDAYTGGDNIPDLYKDAARMLANITNGDIDVSPNVMYFFANNYLDGLSRVIHNSYGIGMVAAGEKEFNPKTDTMVLDSFFGAPSNVDAREFSKVENKIKDKERKLNMFKSDPERYAEYVMENPIDEALVAIYNKAVGGQLNKLNEQANIYRKMPDLTPKERKELLDPIKAQQNLYKRHLISLFEAYDITP